mmetsp:Transcript_5952/g.10870  ORF Transcript_5952/g.10870 Transcript_5952/m.10870 type:complete len:280 (-) Transcript_5952:216-1055(-)
MANQFHFRCKPETIVAETSELSRKSLGDTLDFTIHADTLKIQVGCSEKSASWSLVNTTTLDSYKAVLNNINTSNTVSSCNLVTVEEDVKSISLDSSVIEVLNLDWNSIDEINLELFRLVRSSLRTDSHFEHVVLRTTGSIFETSTFVGGMKEVLINRVVGLGFGIDGDTVLGAVGKQVTASLELFNELSITPRSYALNLGVKCLATHFETNLVISLSGSTVSNVRGALFMGNAHHFLGNARTGNTGTEQVARLINSVGLDGFKDIVFNKVSTQVRDNAL